MTTKDELAAAADKVMSGLMSLRKAANAFNINFMTLHRHVNKLKAAKEGNIDPVRVQVGYAKPRKLFNQDQEKELADYVLNCSKIFFALNTIEARHLAYDYAKKNDLVVPQNWDEVKKASKDWLLSFMKRNPMLSIRTPEPTSLSRMTSFNRHNISEFFNNLGELYEKYKFGPQDVWNIDETGVTTVQKPSKIIASKGMKQVGAATSGERGNLVTVVCAVSASGNSVPPLFVFPRKYFKDYFIVDGPPGSIGAANPSGWVTKDEFLLFIKHFVHHTRCSKERPILIVLDNHNSHMGLNMIDYCRDNGVILLSFPPHTSHKLQPLDKSVYGPFKTYYNSAADGWMKSNPGKTMMIYNIPTIVKLALQNAATPKNIISGFQATGVWPFNRDIFTDADFSASFVTDRPMPNDTASPDLNEHLNQNEHSSSPGLLTSKEREITNEELELENVAIPSTSAENSSEKIHFSPEQIRPYPKAAARVKKSQREEK
ncbi:tigger transposable element-derived protein 6-like protein [Lasius niger]|uniref:Tigger transposable element-derived protein 6-like protein n=1 Tax=Lasius niger TaxID=67767 RepID=A0A0J7KEH1_LASNI|nr:tigger transposable element-derived protein 6-like protein [Lasius niger]